jgi:uncharacterized membrane protein
MNERRSIRRARWGVLATAFLALLFLGGSYAVPWLETVDAGWGGSLRQLYAPVCHQLPARSQAVGDGHQAVCARCTGLYLGGIAGLVVAAGLVVGRGRRIRPIWLALAVAPTLADALLPWVGFPGLPNHPRLVLAIPAGFAAGVFLAVGLADLLASDGRGASSKRKPTQDRNVTRARQPAGAGASVEVLDG